ncbi:MAG: Fic family protein [Acidimicrobiales bacterium]
MNKRAYTVRLPQDQADDLEAVAQVEGLLVAEEIRQAITERIAQRRVDNGVSTPTAGSHRAEPPRVGTSRRVTVEYLDLADFLLIAEAVLGVAADKIALHTKLDLADSALHAPAASFAGEEFYPAIPMKAAVLCAHLVKNHALLDGNKRVALLATIESRHHRLRRP